MRFGICAMVASIVMTSCANQPRPSEISLEKMNGFPVGNAGFFKGVSALYAGAFEGNLWMAGGCNFPDVPVADGGSKVYYEDVYVTPLTEDAVLRWEKVGTLPQASAYGVTVSTGKGLICVGGNTATRSLSDVYLLSLQDDTLQVDTLPSLPVTIDNMAGALLEHTLYVVGGNVDGAPSSDLYMLDLSALKDGWRRGASVPGAPRVQPICVAQGGRLYVWGGFAPATEEVPASVSVDGYTYAPEKQEWTVVATPRDETGEEIFLGGGTGVPLDDGNILCVGGVNRDIFLKAIQGIYTGKEYLSHPVEWYRFNRNLMVYHPQTDSWTTLGAYEQGARAGAALVSLGGAHYIINGELKPGIRTNEINRIKMNKE